MQEKSHISSTPVAMLPKVRVRGLLHLHPSPPSTATATTTVLGPGRTAALQPPLQRVRSQRVHLPRYGPTKPLRLTELLALERLRHTTSRWSPCSNSGGATAAGTVRT